MVMWLLPVAFCGSRCWVASLSAHDLGQFLPHWHTFRCSRPTDVSMSQAAIQGDPFLLVCYLLGRIGETEVVRLGQGVITHSRLCRHLCPDPSMFSTCV